MKKPGLLSVLKDAWRLTLPYFRSEEKWSAIALLVLIIALNFLQVGVTVLLNAWRGEMYNSLQEKDFSGFLHLVFLWRTDDAGFMPGFTPIVCVFIPVAIYTIWLTQLLQIRWRRWLTGRTMQNWLTNRAYYTIALQRTPVAPNPSSPDPAITNATDNPDQRIAEDLNDFTNTTLNLSIDLLSTIVSLISFAQILWTLSGTIEVFGLTIPGYMLFIAIAYAIVGSLLTHFFGRPLAALEFQRQRVEADFRFALIRVRENTEGIALYAGERAENATLLNRFGAVVLNWRQLMNRRKKINALVNGYAQVAAIFPLVIASPRYFAGQIALGGLMRIAGAFSEVQSSLSWFVNSYQALATWRATVARLTSFQDAIAHAQSLATAGPQIQPGTTPAITLDDVTIALPDGRALLDHSALNLPQFRSTTIAGRSGTGKSTLFRALAGIWPFGSGTISRPPGTQLFLPQRPYIPLGTLRQAVTYPAPEGTIPDSAIHQALIDAGLAPLIPELDTDQPWAQRLSGGEQQRLAVARALLLRPDWLFLDEATASLDPEGEAELYATLRHRLPTTTIISIAHRPELATWHDDTLTLKERELTPTPINASPPP